ncbi:MAG: amidohydrolase [Fusobacteriaceae bacterium]
MLNKEALKKKVIDAIDRNREKIISVGKKVYENPELGFKEFKTTETVASFLQELGLNVEKNIAVTGCRAEILGAGEGPNIAILGELDSVTCTDHKDCAIDGAIHACGHNIQIAGMLGAALGLAESNVMENLIGKVTIMATPAEEFIELGFRNSLRESGKLKYFGGKQELIYKGYFDNVDIAMMFHSQDLGEKKAILGPLSNGFIGKEIKFIGKESHAGAAPHEGINALSAATLSLNNIHAQRETFKDSDRVRVHPIITHGGNIVNSVPHDVKMESYVRARTIQGLLDADRKVNRSIQAGALAMGANVEIKSIPGYLPLLKNNSLDNIFRENFNELGIGNDEIIEGSDFTGSFDFGDVSHLIPSIHPMIGGISGKLHTREFDIVDEELAYIIPAKVMALSVIDLLAEKAETAKKIIDEFTPQMSKEEYLKFLEERDKIEFHQNF